MLLSSFRAMALKLSGRTSKQSGDLEASRKMQTATMESESKWAEFWRRNRSIMLMIFAQLFSSLMAVTAKLLQTSNEECGALGTNQVLITMMTITMVLTWAWMLITRVPDAPFGPRSIWPLLSIRGIAGVFGIWGFYYSLRILPLSEATVINFLAPMVAAFASTLLLGIPFTWSQQIAGAVSITGVILVSQPWKMFADPPPSAIPDMMQANFTICDNCTMDMYDFAMPKITTPVGTVSQPGATTTMEHASAIGGALVGVAGGAAAFVAMTWIGKRAHAVITVNYFAAWTVLLSALSFAVLGIDEFRAPNGTEWALLLFLGVFGVLLQLLMAASLQGEGSNRALNMVYTQIVFALIMDEVVWGVRPNAISLVGGMLILASVVAVAFLKEKTSTAAEEKGVRREVHEEEEIEMMVNKDFVVGSEAGSDDEQ